MKVKTWHKVLMVLIIVAAILVAVMYRRSMYESPEQVMNNTQPVTAPAGNVQPVTEPAGNVQPVTESTSNVQPVVHETGYQPANIYSARGSSLGGMTTTRAYDIASIDMDEVKNADDELVKFVETKPEPAETPMVSKSMYTELE